MENHLLKFHESSLLLFFRPKLKHIQNQIQEDVKKITSEQLHASFMGERTKAINGDGYSLLVTPLVRILLRPSESGGCKDDNG
ncbi:hypothetical protein Hanom_Chr12g01147151 [Helianthus anomalus]